jgi:hypothetical protein
MMSKDPEPQRHKLYPIPPEVAELLAGEEEWFTAAQRRWDSKLRAAANLCGVPPDVNAELVQGPDGAAMFKVVQV